MKNIWMMPAHSINTDRLLFSNLITNIPRRRTTSNQASNRKKERNSGVRTQKKETLLASHQSNPMMTGTIISQERFSDDLYALRPLANGVNRNSIQPPVADVRILTSGGLTIPAHSSVLGSVSTVMERILDRSQKKRSSHKIVSILGVPCDAVVEFIRFLYSSRCTEDEMDRYGIHLLALSHVYAVSHLKRKCSKGLSRRLTMENVVDVLQLAKLCDAPDLYLKCMKMVSGHFNDVEKTEGWKFLQNHDPLLELEILQFIDEAEKRQKRRNKKREEQSLYLQLSEAMDCLEHICTEGCTSVGPYDMEPTKNKEPCNKFCTCRGLQLLIRHFALCKKRVNGSCSRCKRMWQLLQLHSSICHQSDHCKVPLCRDFKMKMKVDGKGQDPRWNLLVRKVVSAKVMSSLPLPNARKLVTDQATRKAMNATGRSMRS